MKTSKSYRAMLASHKCKLVQSIFKSRPREWISISELAEITDTRPVTPYISAINKFLGWNIENRQQTVTMNGERRRCSSWCYTPGESEGKEAA